MKIVRHVSTTLSLICAMTTAVAQESGASSDLRESIPERWTYTSEFRQSIPSEDPWWHSFGDEVLDSLVLQAEEMNFDILEAAHRSNSARLAMIQSRSAYYPQIGVTAGYTRDRTTGINTNNWQLGAQMQWEIDLFGEITANVKSKKALYNASRADYAATMVSIAAQTATCYINYRLEQTLVMIAEEHLRSQDEVIKTVNARYEAGLVSKLDVAQAYTLYNSTRASLPTVQGLLRQDLNSLATLVGVYTRDIAPMLEPQTPLPSFEAIVPVGVPADLLRRRPDILAAEAQLAAAAASLGVAKKDFLPTLSLVGEFGVEAAKTKDLFTSDGIHYSIGPSLSWTLFDGFSRKYNVASARESMESAIDAYNLAVMTAVQEVDNAMAAYEAATEAYQYSAEAYRYSREAFDKSYELYKAGLSAFSDVSDAQIDSLTYANAMARNKANALIALIDIYKALGGSPKPY